MSLKDGAGGEASDQKEEVSELRTEVGKLQSAIEFLSRQLQSVISQNANVQGNVDSNKEGQEETSPGSDERTWEETSMVVPISCSVLTNVTTSNPITVSAVGTQQKPIVTSVNVNTVTRQTPTINVSTNGNDKLRVSSVKNVNEFAFNHQQPSIRDIVSILPDFDPCENSLTSIQFIERVEQLSTAYNWPEQLVCSTNENEKCCKIMD